MSDSFLGEIQMFGFPYNPKGWAFCNGAMLPLRQNTALYSLIGTQYGGNGTTTFQLPNLVARAAAGQGTGPSLSPRVMGQTFGSNAVSLTSDQLPAHRHDLVAYAQGAAKRLATPATNGALSMPGTSTVKSFSNAVANTPMAPNMLQPTGGGNPHENRQPYLTVNFCIALEGTFPYFE
ncbi:phage tail protein [Stenotrophomonas sp. LGBM10]|uniref:phage tail protein n=1 Tax=Stenotrophomonas sp. LGBM10 TaxID=3390038 RepID=UPI00398A5CB2